MDAKENMNDQFALFQVPNGTNSGFTMVISFQEYKKLKT